MKAWLLMLLMAGLHVLGACTGNVDKGDPVRGAQLHEMCLDCHGTQPYVRPDRKVKSRDDLRRELLRWGDYYNPALSEQDIDDLFAYLNKDFYKF